jgi:hypothetical protein
LGNNANLTLLPATLFSNANSMTFVYDGDARNIKCISPLFLPPHPVPSAALACKPCRPASLATWLKSVILHCRRGCPPSQTSTTASHILPLPPRTLSYNQLTSVAGSIFNTSTSSTPSLKYANAQVNLNNNNIRAVDTLFASIFTNAGSNVEYVKN